MGFQAATAAAAHHLRKRSDLADWRSGKEVAGGRFWLPKTLWIFLGGPPFQILVDSGWYKILYSLVWGPRPSPGKLSGERVFNLRDFHCERTSVERQDPRHSHWNCTIVVICRLICSIILYVCKLYIYIHIINRSIVIITTIVIIFFFSIWSELWLS